MTRFSSLTRAVLQDRADARWIIHRRAKAAYMGWTNRGNVGDDAMRMAFTKAPGLGDLRHAPIHRAGRLMAMGARCDLLIIGGGTLIGRPEWLTRFQEARKILRPGRVIVMGTGVEDVQFGAPLGITSTGVMKQTARFLSTCDYVGVRGPCSQTALGELGVEAEVVGDPALCLRPRSSSYRAAPANRRIAFNLSSAADGIESAPGSTQREMNRAAAHLSHAGWEVTFFGMERSDQLLANSMVGDRVAVLPWTPDPARMIEFLDSNAFVVSERLHGGILAAARGIPFIQLGYKPKVHDFAASIGAQNDIVDPAHLDAQDLVSRIEAASNEASQWHVLQSRITAIVDRFEATLDGLIHD